jgi:hypothetical protein
LNTFTPLAENTGPWLREQASFLAVQAFIPEVYRGTSNEEDLLEFKQDYLQGWIDQRLPVMLDVDPGYDAHVVFPRSESWGNHRGWREPLDSLRRLAVKGIVFYTWNGYTEGYAALRRRTKAGRARQINNLQPPIFARRTVVNNSFATVFASRIVRCRMWPNCSVF